MLVNNLPYVITPSIPGLDLDKITWKWVREMNKKALRIHEQKQTAVLVVYFSADGCVSFFDGEKDGRICP